MFSTPLEDFLPFISNLKLSSANSFNSEVYNLLFGKLINPCFTTCDMNETNIQPHFQTFQLKMTKKQAFTSQKWEIVSTGWIFNSISQFYYYIKFLVIPFLLDPFSNKPWCSRVCITSLLKILWEKEKFLVRSNFSSSLSVFYLCG